MNILVINRHFYPDDAPTSVLLSDLAFALTRQGDHVTAIAGRLRYHGGAPLTSKRERVHGVDIHRVWSSFRGRSSLVGRVLDYGSFYLAVAWPLWRLARGADFIIAKTDPPLLSVMVAVIARLRGAKHANWLQDIFPEVAEALHVGGPAGDFALRRLRPLRDWSLKTASMNVVIGESMAEHLQALGVSPSRIRVISNWADGNQIKPIPPRQNALRKEWGLNDRFVVGYAGNLGRAHEVDTIIETIALLNRRAIDSPPNDIARRIEFVFVGGGVQHAKLKEEISRRSLGNVEIYPYQPQERLAETLGMSDLHIVSLNPTQEGLIVPSKFYGIAAAGRPTLFIGASDGEIARLVERAGCGFTVSPGDAQTLTSRILQLAGDGELRARMGKRARAAFDKLWDKKHALEKWVDLLKTVAGTRDNPQALPNSKLTRMKR